MAYTESNVASSTIDSIGFDDEENTITVNFSNGKSYEYFGDRQLFDMFLRSSSKGRFFNTILKPQGGHEK